MSIYLTAIEFCERYDKRRIAEIASDTGVPVVDPTLDISNPAADPNIVAAIMGGNADVIGVLRQSDRYQYSWLDQIYFTTDPPHTPPLIYTYPQRQLLISLVAAFAFTRLVARRGMAESELAGLSPLWEDALRTRDAFLHGQIILDDPAGLVALAGVTVKIAPASSLLCRWTANNRLFGVCGCGGCGCSSCGGSSITWGAWGRH